MQLAPQQQQSFPIVNIQPLTYSPLKILSIILVLCAVNLLLFLYYLKIAIIFLLLLPFLFAYLKLVNHYILIDIFYSVQEEDRQNIQKYAIYDLSINFDKTNNRKANKIYVVNIHFSKNRVKYFYFKEQLFKIQKELVSKVNEQDTMNILEIQDFQKFTHFGLTENMTRISQQLFKNENKYIKPSFFNFIMKRFYEQKEWVLLNTYLILISFVIASSTIIPIFLIIVNIAVAALILFDQNKKVEKFRQKFQFIGEKQFSVYREGLKRKRRFDQIIVGDIIQIEKTQQIECLTYFTSLLLGNVEIICKQGQKKEQSIKRPIRSIGDLNQDRKSRYIIKTLSYIQKASLRGNEHLIVLQNNSITKFFHLWFNKQYYNEFISPFREHAIKSLQLFTIGGAVLLVAFIIITLARGESITQPYKQQMIGRFVAVIMALPSIMHLLLCLNHSKSTRELQKSDIQLLGVNILNAGCISNILINFQQLLQVQFQQILYKNLIFDPTSRPFQPDSATLQSGRTYQSLLALIFYISLGYLDEQQNKPTFLRQIYKLYEDYFALQDNLYDSKDIVHLASKKVWRVVHKDSENEEGARSWRIQYQNQLKYIITECNIKDQKTFSKYIGNQDKNKLNDYIELAQNLMQEGKKIKLILFKNFRKEYTGIRGTQLSVQSEDQFKNMDRQALEKKLQFAAFIIFDNAIKQQKLQILEQLRSMENQKERLFNLLIYSQNKSQNIAGFQHILQNVPIYYSYKKNQKTMLIRKYLQNFTSILISFDLQDQYADLLADLSIKVQSKQRSNHKILQFISPSDAYLKDMNSIKDMLEIGHFSVKFSFQVIKYCFIISFWMLFGLLWISVHTKGHFQYSQPWIVTIFVLLIILPLSIKNQFFFNKTLKNYKLNSSIFTLTFLTQLMLTLLISIFILIFINQFPLCQQPNRYTQSHTLAFRMHQSGDTHIYQCMNIPLLLAGAASFLSYAILYQESQLAKFEIRKFAIIIVWIVLMVIAQLPLKIILFSIGLIVFLILTKLLVKFAGRETKDSETTFLK